MTIILANPGDTVYNETLDYPYSGYAIYVNPKESEVNTKGFRNKARVIWTALRGRSLMALPPIVITNCVFTAKQGTNEHL